MVNKVSIGVILALVLVVFTSQSQDNGSLSSKNLSTVNVDKLSDDQIQKFIDRAEDSGLSQAQLEILARQRGMSASEISKLRNRINNLNLSKSSGTLKTNSRAREEVEQADGFDFFDELALAEDKIEKRTKIFGSNIFASTTMGFTPVQNVATPSNYVLGPGDEIIIDIYGASEITYQQVISPDGKIFVSGVGPISLVGISIETARKRIFNKLSTIYSGLKRPNPNTFIEVTIGSLRTIKVDVMGEAKRPGSYSLSSFSTAFNALYAAGGPSENGSMRKIEIVRSGKKIATLDIYKYYYNGDISNNPRLKDEDVIIVKSRLNRIELIGEVKYEGFLEFKPEETIGDIFDFSGGFNSRAYKNKITIDGYEGAKRRILSVDSSEFREVRLTDGDKISVSKAIDKYINRVQIEGAVYKPGFYELKQGMTIQQLVAEAEGLREDVYKGRGNILRQNSDLSLSNISFDINELLAKNLFIELENEDIIQIPSISDIKIEETVILEGEVRKPGEYIFADSLTVEDLINLAGGLKNTASASKIEVARRLPKGANGTKSSDVFEFEIDKNLELTDSASDFFLEPFDVVLVKATASYRQQKLIRIEGEVKFPGVYALETEEDKISNLIERAGGTTNFAYTKGASLIRNIQSDNDETTRTNIAQDFRRSLFEDRVVADSIDDSVLDTRIGVGIELDKALSNPSSKYNFILQDGDLISVPKKLETVKINGEVFFTTTVKHDPSYNFKKYVALAGGFNSSAKKGKSYVIYANGRAARTKSFLGIKSYPKVLPGSDIIVPQKPERRQLSTGEVLGITSGLASLSLVILQIINISQ